MYVGAASTFARHRRVYERSGDSFTALVSCTGSGFRAVMGWWQPAGAASATVLSQYVAVAVYGTLLWRGARSGEMMVPFFAPGASKKRRLGAVTPPKEEGAGGGGRGGAGDTQGVQPLSLLTTVISANAAMLLR